MSMPGRPPLQIILASASPRRKQLMAEAGYKFKVVFPHIDESTVTAGRISTSEYARLLALAKAKDVAAGFPNHLVIAADTVVDFDGRIIGKPTDAKHAERIIRKIFSAPHKVITGLALVRQSDGTEICKSDTTVVYPGKMTEEQISQHIKTGRWHDKAGAYAIREKDDPFIERIDGSLTNVMGLPMKLLNSLLRKFVRQSE